MAMDEANDGMMIHFARNRYATSSMVETTFDKMFHYTDSTVAAPASSTFFKFLARFSGRRRISYRLRRISSLLFPYVAIFLILSTVCRVTDACSSRTTPKPRPPSPTARPNITFHTYKCPPAYAAWYCLNDATCFTVKIGDSLLYNCECADGYMGPRCEYKDLDGSYLPTRPRVMLETASIASGAIVALVLAVIVWCYICVQKHQQKKRLEITNGGVDTVDSSVRRPRPFGSHHLQTIPLSEWLNR
ncbi:pro-epidermal growth factor-like isoform X1 [Armigeres subalbatus]|uniref:pro-epidermal growth factor-like isoform X1 n=1 Tax=Armigeres subalbatus TaxID=124917 RepID=UPI002ED42044